MSEEKGNTAKVAEAVPEAVGPAGSLGSGQLPRPTSSVLGATGPGDPNLQTEVPGPEKLQHDMDVLRKEVEGVKQKLERESNSAILAIGVFASVITFLSVQIQILGNATNIYELAFLSLLTLAGLLSFLLLIFALVHMPKKGALWLVVTAIIIILVLGSAWFAIKIPTLASTAAIKEPIMEPASQDKSENQTTVTGNQATSTEVQN